MMSNAPMHTRDRIVELGREYIQRVGYHAFSYRQIATTLNIKNAAIHHYYPSKEDLGVAVVKKDHQDFKCMTGATVTMTPLEKLEALTDTYRGFFNADRKLCVIGTFETIIHEIPESIRTAANVYLEDMFYWLKNTMQEGLDKGDFNFKQSAAEMAEFWIAVLPASLMTARLRGETAFNGLLQQLKNNLILI